MFDFKPGTIFSVALDPRAILVGVIALLVLKLYFRGRIPNGLRLPPGPPRKPVLGNIFHLPHQQEWVTFAKWAKEYGDLVYLSGFGHSIMLVNSADVAYELFEKRSSIYSDRGEFPMIHDLLGGGDWLTSFIHYGEQWRKHRKVMHQKLRLGAVVEHQPVQLKHTRALLQRLVETPDYFVEHVRHISGAIIMEVLYGIEILPKNDPYLIIAENAMTGLIAAGIPGAFLVDTLPILKYVPEWFPGAGFQKKAKIWRQFTVEMNTVPFEVVKKALKSGNAKPSFTSSLLQEISANDGIALEQEKVIRDAGSTLYAAGSDTTLNTIHVFFLAMALYPEAQRKAQEELDRVVGVNRLPEYEDRENLRYINALCKEVYRWHPIGQVAIPHRLTQNDVFNGYFIPAGTLLLGNTWKLLHDEATYGPDTDKFHPERFLTPGAKSPEAAFGYGRRSCPGRYFADNSVYIAVASILSVFDIGPPRDSTGNTILSEAAFISGAITRPVTFKCTITPRSDTAKILIRQGN